MWRNSGVDQAILDLNGEKALSIVDGMALEPRQKELLRFDIALSQGNLTTAFFGIARIRGMSPSAAPELNAMEKDVRDLAAKFKTISEKIDWYLYSPLSVGSCSTAWAQNELPKKDFSLLEYMRMLQEASKTYPLSPWILDRVFHAALLTASYEDLQSLGDRILDAKGSIKIPFYSRQSLFWVVIDSRKRRLYTEENQAASQNEAGTDDLEDMVAFDLKFDDITALSQKAQSNLSTGGLGSKSYALKIEPSGLAPNYAFMGLSQCLYGESMQKNATRNLGQYIAHVIGVPHLRVQLVDPQKRTKDWGGSVAAALAVGETIAADYLRQTNSGNLAADGLSTSAGQLAEIKIANAEAYGSVRASQEADLNTWNRLQTKRAFSAIESDKARALTKEVDAILTTSGN